MISDSGRIFFLHEEVETEFPQLNRNDFQVSLLRQENEKGVMKFVLYKHSFRWNESFNMKWNYLKTSEEAKDYSPCELLENQGPFEFPILCDTGSADEYKKDHWWSHTSCKSSTTEESWKSIVYRRTSKISRKTSL